MKQSSKTKKWNYHVLPEKYVFKEDDLLWDDIFLPLGFRPNFQRSIFKPVSENQFPTEKGIAIFGPPGTGKTTVVKSIAKQLGWEYFYIGPQHFVRQQCTIEDAMKTCIREIVEYVKKNAIKQKTEKSEFWAKMVFTFDEIDELVVTRDSGTDRQTRISTTMMLPLIQELRDLAQKYGFIFFVLTNHIERFDPAILRNGRFDLILPLGPPDRQARFLLFESFLDKERKKNKAKYNVEIKTDYEFSVRKEKRIEVRADLNVISRASARLTLKDIEAVCQRVAEHEIASHPSLLHHTVTKDLYLHTRYFIDWIYKFRHLGSSKNEIEKFYKDRDVYTRGSTLYTKPNTLQEKVEHEFSSLYIKHNLKDLDGTWKRNETNAIKFTLLNLSGLSPFKGQITVIVETEEGEDVGSSKKNEEIMPGAHSQNYLLSISPTNSKKIKVTFKITGIFDLIGIEDILEDNHASLSGTFIQTREIKTI